MGQSVQAISNYFYNLVWFANIDGAITDHEYLFLKQKAKEVGVDDETFALILNNVNDIELVIPNQYDHRLLLLTDAITMVLADKVVTKEEYHELLRIAVSLNMDKIDLDVLLASKNK